MSRKGHEGGVLDTTGRLRKVGSCSLPNLLGGSSSVGNYRVNRAVEGIAVP